MMSFNQLLLTQANTYIYIYIYIYVLACVNNEALEGPIS